jgi:uncharacterized membrane protein YfcA
LIYWVGYNRHRAVGTSLAVLLPPVGLAATLEYYRKGDVDIRAAMIIAVSMLLGGYAGAFVANKLTCKVSLGIASKSEIACLWVRDGVEFFWTPGP